MKITHKVCHRAKWVGNRGKSGWSAFFGCNRFSSWVKRVQKWL